MSSDNRPTCNLLVLAPQGRDAAVIVQVLTPLIRTSSTCSNLRELVNLLSDSSTVAVVTEESLRDEAAGDLHGWIKNQPSWSDFPFVVLAATQRGSRSSVASQTLAQLGNEVLLERPLNSQTLLSAVKSAIRSRQRQYQARTHLEQQRAFALEKQRLYESEVQARADAEAANREKDEFLATLSHELRTPLSAIIGWTYVMQKRRADFGDLAKGIDAIERSAKAQSRLVEDLLDMSRIVAGKVNLEYETVIPARLIEEVIASVQPASQARGVAIEHYLEPALVAICADPHRLRQVLWNLLTNAIKFTDPGGKVSVAAEIDGASLVIRIIDTGVGIAPDFLPLVFDRFRQADGSTTRSHGGLGLGLAIGRRLMELHGGQVEAHSAGLGQGSTFTVRLPLTEEQAIADVASATLPNHRDPEASLEEVDILLVEDDPDGREMIAQLLTDGGGQVRAVASAVEALEALAEKVFDIVVSDIGMPDIDGYQLLERIRASGNGVPAIALTAFARTEDKNKALVAGYSAHLSKPVEAPMLIQAVKHASRRK